MSILKSSRDVLTAGIAAFAIGAAVVALSPTPAAAFGLGHMGGFGNMGGMGRMGNVGHVGGFGRMGGMGHTGNLGHTTTSHNVGNVAHNTPTERTSSANGSRTGDLGKTTSDKPATDKFTSDKTATGKTGGDTQMAANSDRATPAKDTDAKPNQVQVDKPNPDRSTTDERFHHPVPTLPMTPTGQLYTPIAGDPEIVEVNCCYAKKETIGKVTFVSCAPRRSPPSHPGLCTGATCTLYIDGEPQLNSGAHLYDPNSTYTCISD